MKTVRLVALGMLILISFVGWAQPSGQSNAGSIPMAKTDFVKRKWLNLPYANVSSAQQLDIYLPDQGNGPFPVIVSIHGGAFMAGDKGDVQLLPMLEGLRRGYAVVSVNYRMSGEALFPKLVHDVKAAVRWIRANAGQYNLNPDKIAAWGGSAGGHLSAMIGTSGDVKELDDLSLGNSSQSSRVQTVVDWFGPIDFLAMDDEFQARGVKGMIHNTADSPESKLLGKQITRVPEKVKAINPATYLSKDDPPFFIQHGTNDMLIPYEESVRFAEALTKTLGKEKVTVELLKGAGHGTPEFSTPENVRKVLDFLDNHLKK